MSGQGKGCGLLDFPEAFRKTFNEISKRVDGGFIDKLVLRSEIDGNEKKYIIEVPMLQFVGEFHRGNGCEIVFDAKWGTHSKVVEYYTSAEQAACEWLLDTIHSGRCFFTNIEMEMISSKNITIEDTNGVVNALDINVTDDNIHEKSLLESWIERFTNGVGLLRINSTSEEAYHFSEGFEIAEGHLQLKGRFVIPLDVLLQINAKKIMFEDYSESSNINEDYIVGILENWLNRVEKPKTITFVANFEGSDIGEKVFEQINAIFVRDNELPGTWFHNIPKKNAKITFCHNGNNFEMKIYDSRE